MKFNGFEMNGTSTSGIGTCLQLPDYKLIFDMGICPDSATRIRTVLITHGHVDHLAGIIKHAYTRNMMRMKPSRFVVPEHLVDPISRMFDIWESLQHKTIKYEVIPLSVGEELKLGKGVEVAPFPTDHRVPSQGYALWRTKRKLKPEFKDLPGKEIGRLRTEEGVEVTDEVKTLEVVYTGDTRANALDLDVVRKTRTLITEATFLTEAHDVYFAQDRGHTHLFEVADRSDRLGAVEDIILTHFSARYSNEQIVKAWEVLPQPFRSKVFPFVEGRN